jgi:acyl-CoA synthetase (AMP-forming)/AMP-acid ligase II
MLLGGKELPGQWVPQALYLATDELPDEGAPPPSLHPALTEVALLQYTSGSTGHPRGVMLTHANVMNNQRALAAALRASPGETWVQWLPLYHDLGLIAGVLYPVYAGFTMCLMSPLAFLQKPIRWLQAIHRFRARATMAPCFAYRLCSEGRNSRNGKELDLSSWRLAICAGETIRAKWLEGFAATFRPAGFDARAFLPAYGLAEVTLMATASPIGTGVRTHDVRVGDGDVTSARSVRSLVNCGPAGQDQQIAIVDPVSCRRVSPGDPGEIWLQGPSVAAGYWAQPEETRATFQAVIADESEAGCWLRTGDLGFLSPDGLVVTGRAKEVIVMRGANYDPFDIEVAAQESHAALALGSGGAFSVETDDGDALVLVNEVRRTALRDLDVSVIAATVIEAISRRFGLTLDDLVLIRPGTLPRTTSGKIRRGVCREKYLAGEHATLGAIDLPTLGRSRRRAGRLTQCPP